MKTRVMDENTLKGLLMKVFYTDLYFVINNKQTFVTATSLT